MEKSPPNSKVPPNCLPNLAREMSQWEVWPTSKSLDIVGNSWEALLTLMSPCLAFAMASWRSMPFWKNVAMVVANPSSVCGLPIELEEFMAICYH